MPDITPLFTVANQVLVNFFDKSDTENYVSHIIEDKHSDEEYLITMQRIKGETPLHQLATEKEQNEVLQSKINELKTLLKKEMSRNAFVEVTGKSLADIRSDAINEMGFDLTKNSTELSKADIEKYADNLVADQ